MAAAVLDVFFGNRGTITIDSGTHCAVYKGIEITPKFDVVKLYGGGTILWADVARHSFRVEVKIKTAKFDVGLTTSFMYKILNPASPSGGTVSDSNVCGLFTVVATATGSAGQICKQTVTNVYFESIPVGLPENDWWTPEFSGEGQNITFANS